MKWRSYNQGEKTMSTYIYTRLGVLVVSCVVAAGLAACSARVPNDLKSVPLSTESGGTQQATADARLGANTPQAQSGERYDPAAEEAIATESLRAWRIAVKHAKKDTGETDADWQKQRVADEKESMDALRKLSEDHPHSSTVFFMMGQVEDHFGKNKEATAFFDKARQKNTKNPLSLFKLAQSEQQGGNLKDAIGHYRELLTIAPDFYPGKVGLAQCLVKENPAEAHELAQSVLSVKPKPANFGGTDPDAESIKAAQQIVSETKGGNPSH
jgi:predicted Zn-dependent protease